MIYSISVTLMPRSVAVVCVDTLDTFVFKGSDFSSIADFRDKFNSWLRPGDHTIVGDWDSVTWFVAQGTKIKETQRPLPETEEQATREDCEFFHMNYDLYTALCIAWRYHEI